MADRWYIHRDGRDFGPFEAGEIRAALRDGTWDPFVLVFKEGSSVKRPLVDVDEIFMSTGVNKSAPISNAAEPLSGIEDGEISHTFSSPLPMQDAGGHIPVAKEKPARKEKDYGEVPEMSRRKSGKPRRKRDPKRFFLKDTNGRLLGPLSAGEIQSLFYKGVLDKGVKVFKEGSSSSVPVAKFVAVYSEKRRKKAMQGAHPTLVGGMSTSQLHQVALAHQVQAKAGFDIRPWLPWVVMILGVILISMAGWFYMSMKNEMASREVRKPSQVKKAPKKLKRTPWQGKLNRPKTFKTKKVARPKTTYSRTIKRTPAKKKQKTIERPSRRSSAPKPRRTTVTRPPTRSAPIQVYKKPKSQAVTSNAPKPVKKVSAPAKANPFASFSTGQAVSSLGPVSYSVSAVKSCSGACSVTFSYGGAALYGKFFGDAFKNQLVAKGGKAYISGTITKNGSAVSIIINGVK